MYCKQSAEEYNNIDGYKLQKGCQQIILIEGLDEEKVWQNYKKRIRRDVRKAKGAGVKVKKLTESNEIEKLFELYLRTMRRNKACPVWSKKAFYSIYDNLVLKNKAEMIFADLNNKYIAGVISIYSEDTCYYFMSASDAEYLKYCPNDLLLHTIIADSISKNKKHVDLMTSRESDTELIKFKDKWGSQKYPSYIFEKDLHLLRANIWSWCWKMANSRIGGFLLKAFRN